MRIYKRKANRNGRMTTGTKWTVDFYDAKYGTNRPCPGYADKAATATLGRRLESLAARAAAREELTPDLRQWLDEQPAVMLNRLRKWGLIDTARQAAGKALNQHVDDYHACLLSRGVKPKVADLAKTRLQHLFQVAGLRFWAELSVSKIQNAIGRLTKVTRTRNDSGQWQYIHKPIKSQTRNAYITAVKSFAKWMVTDQRASASPLDGLAKAKVTDASERRAATVNELRRLISAAQRGPTFSWGGGRGPKADRPFSISGKERALLYRVAAETGLRVAELRSLTRANFEVDSLPHRVTIDAGSAKNMKAASIGLRQDTALLLREHLQRKAPAAAAFNVPPSDRTAKMLRIDAEAAGVAYRNTAGHVLDFHALRHTFITNVANSGASVKTIQELARHSTPVLTIGRYAHANDDQKVAALAALPDLLPLDEVNTKTGTTDGCDHHENVTALVTGLPRAAMRQRAFACHKNVEARHSENAEKDCENAKKPRKNLKPPAGVEPATCALQMRCSAN